METLKSILSAGLCLAGIICLWRILYWKSQAAKAYFLLGRQSEEYEDICNWAYSKAIRLGYHKAWKYYALSAMEKFMDVKPRKVYVQNGAKCIVNYYYVPYRLLDYATDADYRRYNDIRLFKMGTYGNAPYFISYVCDDFEVAWGSLLVFIPCSTEKGYLKRYGELAEKISHYTGRVKPMLDAVEYIWDRDAKHRHTCGAGKSEDGVMSNVRLTDRLYGQNVVVFDDVTTKGTSINEFVDALRSKGAHVDIVICLAKTVKMPGRMEVYRQALKDSKVQPKEIDEALYPERHSVHEDKKQRSDRRGVRKFVKC